eukprot:3475240-Amphidinium_carterae.1
MGLLQHAHELVGNESDDVTTHLSKLLSSLHDTTDTHCLEELERKQLQFLFGSSEMRKKLEGNTEHIGHAQYK